MSTPNDTELEDWKIPPKVQKLSGHVRNEYERLKADGKPENEIWDHLRAEVDASGLKAEFLEANQKHVEFFEHICKILERRGVKIPKHITKYRKSD